MGKEGEREGVRAEGKEKAEFASVPRGDPARIACMPWNWVDYLSPRHLLSITRPVVVSFSSASVSDIFSPLVSRAWLGRSRL